MSQPWMKFYPRDWRGDQALRAVSIGARGFWMECLCIMHEAKPYGHLTLNGKAIPITVLARMSGVSFEEAETFLSELVHAGVCYLTRAGIHYSKRMVADGAAADKGRKAANSRWSQGTDLFEQNDGPNTQIPDTRSQRPETRKKEGKVYSSGSASSEPSEAGSEIVVGEVVSEVDLAVQAYNEAAEKCDWPRARPGPGDKRLKPITARLKEVGLAGWRAMIVRAATSDFLGGRAPRGNGHSNWTVNLEWLATAGNFTKVMEGNYDNRGGARRSVGLDSAMAGIGDFLRENGHG